MAQFDQTYLLIFSLHAFPQKPQAKRKSCYYYSKKPNKGFKPKCQFSLACCIWNFTGFFLQLNVSMLDCLMAMPLGEEKLTISNLVEEGKPAGSRTALDTLVQESDNWLY